MPLMTQLRPRRPGHYLLCLPTIKVTGDASKLMQIRSRGSPRGGAGIIVSNARDLFHKHNSPVRVTDRSTGEMPRTPGGGRERGIQGNYVCLAG